VTGAGKWMAEKVSRLRKDALLEIEVIARL